LQLKLVNLECQTGCNDSSKDRSAPPSCFWDVSVDGVGGVLANWEKLKAAERQAKDEKTPKGLLDGVPNHLPALAQAQEIQERAARVGFDWPEIQGVIQKIGEELEEVHQAPTSEALMGELGDLLFAVVNLARWKKVDSESALRETNKRFRQRFAFIEKAARETGSSVDKLSLKNWTISGGCQAGPKPVVSFYLDGVSCSVNLRLRYRLEPSRKVA
jgi:MazG family protein